MSPAIRTAERDHSLGSVRSSLKPTRPSEMPETREQAAPRKAPWRTGTRAWPAWATGPQNPDSAASRRPHSAPVRHLHNRLLQMASLPPWTSTRHRAKDTHIDTDARRTCRRPTGSALRRPRETAHTWPLDCVAWSRSAGGMDRRGAADDISISRRQLLSPARRYSRTATEPSFTTQRIRQPVRCVGYQWAGRILAAMHTQARSRGVCP